MLPTANDLKTWHSLSILKWCDFILVLRSCDIKCYNNHYLATNSNFSSEKARLKTVNPSLAVPPSFLFCWVSDHPASCPETLSWHVVPSTARTVVLQLSCDGIWLPQSMGEGPVISAHLRVSPQHCTWPRRLQTWYTDRGGGVPFHLTWVFATKKNALIEAGGRHSTSCACVLLACLTYPPACCMVLLLSLHLPRGCHCYQRRHFQLCPCIISHLLQRLLVGVGLIAIPV